ncbi:MAG: Ldh family oxidoreductase, partial [Planctomycetota bacterium]
HNASFTVFDVTAFSSREDFQTRLRTHIDELHSSPTAEGVERVLFPGEKEWSRYRLALQQGVALPLDVEESLQRAAELTGISFS